MNEKPKSCPECGHTEADPDLVRKYRKMFEEPPPPDHKTTVITLMGAVLVAFLLHYSLSLV